MKSGARSAVTGTGVLIRTGSVGCGACAIGVDVDVAGFSPGVSSDEAEVGDTAAGGIEVGVGTADSVEPVNTGDSAGLPPHAAVNANSTSINEIASTIRMFRRSIVPIEPSHSVYT